MNNELKKIMLVEDEEDIRTIVTFSLQKIGHYTVCACPSGKEALDSISEFNPDLILLDMMMPDMDGAMVLKAIREIKQFNHVPVIFMTAKVLGPEIANYKTLGAIDVISKPFNPKELPSKLEHIWLEHIGAMNEH